MLYNTWSAAMRKMLRIDRASHRYLIEPLSDSQHMKISLMKRFRSFQRSLSETKKRAARYVYHAVANDCRSHIGRNIRILEIEQTSSGKKVDLNSVPFFPLPTQEKWRLCMIKELLNMRENGTANNVGWKKEQVVEVLKELCTS